MKETQTPLGQQWALPSIKAGLLSCRVVHLALLAKGHGDIGTWSGILIGLAGPAWRLWPRASRRSAVPRTETPGTLRSRGFHGRGA